VQGWNCQIAVDAAHQIIVAQAVTNQPPDVEHLMPLLHQVVANCGEVPAATLGDAGYFSEKNVAATTALGTDPYLATGRLKRGETPPTVQDPAPNKLTAKQRMARKLATPDGAAIYARRKAIVEPVFGQINGARGLRAFLLRGVTKVRGEWSLMTLCHNPLKLHGIAQAA
jgi:Transposase DDE domain